MELETAIRFDNNKLLSKTWFFMLVVILKFLMSSPKHKNFMFKWPFKTNLEVLELLFELLY